jgi:hypothetical protein
LLLTAGYVIGLTASVHGAIARGDITQEAADAWWQAMMQRDAAGAFFGTTNSSGVVT